MPLGGENPPRSTYYDQGKFGRLFPSLPPFAMDSPQLREALVAEVFIGLLEGDRLSYLRQDPEWKPTLSSTGDFTMVDLLKFAGVVPAL
jgi:hypothetical protein